MNQSDRHTVVLRTKLYDFHRGLTEPVNEFLIDDKSAGLA